MDHIAEAILILKIQIAQKEQTIRALEELRTRPSVAKFREIKPSNSRPKWSAERKAAHATGMKTAWKKRKTAGKKTQGKR